MGFMQISFSQLNHLNICYWYTDVDECSGSLDVCDKNAACTNNPGSYRCDCEVGYEGNGTHCQGKSS